jgi:small-conductance mechanosensitive channel
MEKRDGREQAEADILKQEDESVRSALKEARTEPAPPVAPAEKPHTIWFWPYVIALAVLAVMYALWQSHLVDAIESATPVLERFTTAAIIVTLVLAIQRAAILYLISQVESAASRYNLRQVLRLVAALVCLLVILSALVVNWYALFASLGLVSLILGLALQHPLTSFFAWVYILVRNPYRVGDRIRIGAITGDVIKVTYLDTTLWEIRGDYLTTDHPSGRIVKFPNSQVFSTPVYNYSWPLFPYIWNEIKFHVAYSSDLAFVARVMQEVVEAELGKEMLGRVGVYCNLLAETPVDQLLVRERPHAFFRVGDNTWLDAIVRYLVHPKESGRVKTNLIYKLLTRLNEHPERVMFPKDNQR